MKNRYELEAEELKKDFDKKMSELTRKSIESKKHRIPKENRILAEFIHEKICTHDHTEHCDWFYDDGSWSSYSRENFLEMSSKILKRESFDIEEFKAVMDIIFPMR